jgi:hypothetical protein
MVKKILFAAFIVFGLIVSPQPVIAGCATTLADCYTEAAKIDSFWYRWAAGLDCEFDFVECARIKLIGA